MKEQSVVWSEVASEQKSFQMKAMRWAGGNGVMPWETQSVDNKFEKSRFQETEFGGRVHNGLACEEHVGRKISFKIMAITHIQLIVIVVVVVVVRYMCMCMFMEQRD